MNTKKQTNGLKARVGVLGMGIMGSAMAMGKALEDTASAAEVLSAMAGIPAAPLKIS